MLKETLTLYGETLSVSLKPGNRIAIEVNENPKGEFGPDFAFLFESTEDFKRFVKMINRFDEALSLFAFLFESTEDFKRFVKMINRFDEALSLTGFKNETA